jgi:glycosyltransferase involved in cell wall biosynthesis
MVRSVRKAVGTNYHEIILVDGGSTDGTIEWCKTQGDIRLIEQGELLGAIKAFNAGARAAQGQVVALLNDDITVKGYSLDRAYEYLKRNPDAAQVALINDVQGTSDKHRRPTAKIFGYPYGQCSVTWRHLGDYAGWWGDEGMRTYGGDSRLSLRLWEMGYKTAVVKGCEIVDYVVEDELRKINNADQRGPGRDHPDSVRFLEVWRGRLPHRASWRGRATNRIIHRAAHRELRTLRFKGMMSADHQMRTALINEFKKYGPAQQINRAAIVREQGLKGYQQHVLKVVKSFTPDLIIFQGQREGSIEAETVRKVKGLAPWALTINFDGDTHYPLTDWHFEIAREVDLQLVVSPTLFGEYGRHGAYVGYWPIGIEHAYAEASRAPVPEGPDVIFMGALYGIGTFPEAETRRDSVLRISQENVDLDLYGRGWNKVGLGTKTVTNERHAYNAKLYAQAKMALSVSQSAELWGYTSDRLYNITATGCPALVQCFAGMEEHGYVDGKTCIAWNTLNEMADKMHYYLNHEEEREEIGRQGRRMTLNRHTWEKRLEGLFAMIGGLEYDC